MPEWQQAGHTLGRSSTALISRLPVDGMKQGHYVYEVAGGHYRDTGP